MSVNHPPHTHTTLRLVIYKFLSLSLSPSPLRPSPRTSCCIFYGIMYMHNFYVYMVILVALFFRCSPPPLRASMIDHYGI